MPEFSHFTETRKNPLNMFRLRELTTAQSPEPLRRRRLRCVLFVVFPHNHCNFQGLALSLTFRQGDFADDLSEEGMRAQASGTS
jgi:hypothetical protein